MVYIRIYTFMLLCISFQGKADKLKSLTLEGVSIELDRISEKLKSSTFNTLSNEKKREILQNFKLQIPFYKRINEGFLWCNKYLPEVIHQALIGDIKPYLYAYLDLFNSVDLTKIDNTNEIQTSLEKKSKVDQQILSILEPILNYLKEHPYIPAPRSELIYTINILKKSGFLLSPERVNNT